MVYLYIVLGHHGCSLGLLDTHPTTIHYTPPRFILRDHWRYWASQLRMLYTRRCVLARPVRITSLGNWSLTRATSSATLNKRAGWLTDPTTSGKWGESDSKRCLALTSTPISVSPRTLSPTS